MKKIMFLKKDLIAALAYWIIQQCERIPTSLSSILNDAGKFIDQNEPCEATVAILGFKPYELNLSDLRSYCFKLIASGAVASINNLGYKDRNEDGVSLDEVALARNVANTVFENNDNERKISSSIKL